MCRAVKEDVICIKHVRMKELKGGGIVEVNEKKVKRQGEVRFEPFLV